MTQSCFFESGDAIGSIALAALECAGYCQALIDHGEHFWEVYKFLNEQQVSIPDFSLQDDGAFEKFKQSVTSEIWWQFQLKSKYYRDFESACAQAI